MTLKKSKGNRGQSIFEYFILTTAVAAVVLFFAANPHFINIRNSTENAFSRAALSILGQEDAVGGSGSPGGVSTPGAGQAFMYLTSPAFENNQFIPIRFTADGQNINPVLIIGEVPKETKSLALILEDPDAPGGTFVHWVVFDIPVVGQIPENSIPGKQGINDFGTTKYMGPDPPPGAEHRYLFKIYALDTMLNLPEGISKPQLEQAMVGHKLAEVVLIGLYKR